MSYYDLDKIFGRPTNKVYDMKDIFGASDYYELSQVFDTRKKMDKYAEQTEQRQKPSDVWDILEQFGQGFASEATLGLSKKVWEEQEPTDVAGQISRGMGSFLGFMALPIQIGKVAGAGVKAGLKKLAPKIGESMLGRLGAHILPQMATLGTAEAVSDITDIGGAPGRFVHGAKIGAIFGAAGLTHATDNKFVNQLLSQFGGRALMAVAGEYSRESFTRENLPQLIFSEALNTFFLRSGVEPYEVLTGDMPKWKKNKVRAWEEEVQKINRQSKALDLQVRPEEFMKDQATTVNLFEDVEAPARTLERERVDEIKKQLHKGLWDEVVNRIRGDWDPEQEKYMLSSKDPRFNVASALQALREYFHEGQAEGDEKATYEMTIAARGHPEAKRPRLPSPQEAAALWMRDFVDPQLIDDIQRTKQFAYDTKKKVIRPIFSGGEHGIKANEILIEKDSTDHWIHRGNGRDIVKNLTEKQIDKALKKAIKEAGKMTRVPLQELPESFDERVQERLEAIYNEFTSPDTFYNLIGLEGRPKIIDMLTIEDVMDKMGNIPPGSRVEYLIDMFRDAHNLHEYAGTEKWDYDLYSRVPEPDPEKVDNKLTQDLKKRQEIDDVYLSQQRYDRLMKIRSQIKTGKTEGSVLMNLMKVKWLGRWRNAQKMFHDLTMKTGIPFWELSRKLHFARREVDRTLNELLEPLVKYQDLSQDQQLRVIEYYEAKSSFADTSDIVGLMGDKAKNYIKEIDDLMSLISPNITYWRVLAALEDPEKPIFKNQESEHIQEKLAQARQIMQNAAVAGRDPSLAIMEESMPGGILEGLGVMENGVYLPSLVLGRKPSQQLTHREFYNYADVQGLTHLQSRGKIISRRGKAFLLEDAALDLTNEHLNQRIHSYVRQVLNAVHLRPHLKAMESVIDLFYHHMAAIKGGQKDFNFIDMMRLYAHRKKGFPVHVGAFGSVLKKIQARFFRALTVKPYLLLRNLFQRGVTAVNKRILAPKYMFTRFKVYVPEEYQDRFNTEVSQMQAVEYHQFFGHELQELELKPIRGALWRLAKKVGHAYSVTDLWNRQSVYAKSWRLLHDEVQDYYDGKIDIEKLEKRLALERIDPLERKKIRFELAQQNIEEAAHEYSTWMVDNSQWIYERGEKSIIEMTGEGEAYTNLLTWSKGILQATSDAANRFMEGVDRGDKTMMAGSAKWFLGTMLAGAVANQLLKHVSLKHGNRYSDYGVDMFFWEFGGVSLDIVNSFTESISNLATSFDDTPEARREAVDEFIRNADNMGIRQMIPFAKQALSIIESITGSSYVSPIYNVISKRGLSKVDRTLTEGFIHAALATDPTKSPEVRRWVNFQAEKFNSMNLHAQAPWLKAYYGVRAKHYAYLADLLNRYEPIEVYHMYARREIEKMERERSSEGYLRELARIRNAAARDRRKQAMGYIIARNF